LSGIADDSLIPSFTQLFRATGNAKQAMDSLNLAIEVSRGSTNGLNEVVDALSKGYAGNTRGLGNLDLGLNKAFLATGDMVAITAELNKQFSGASAAYLDTYAGKIEVLNNQWNDTKQIVGQGLVMAFQEATGNRGVGGMTDAMEKFGYIVDAILIKTGTLINTLTNNVPFISDLLKRVVDGWAYILDVKGTELAIQNEIWKANTKTWEMAQKTADDQAKRNKEYLAFLAKQKKLTDAAALAAKKKAADEAALKKAASLFDIDKIQIIAALQRNITEDEKLRLKLQMAILQENGSEAERLAKELAASQLQTTNLSLAISRIPRALNPFEGWGSEIDNLLAKMIQLYAMLQFKTPQLTGTVKAQVTKENAASVLANAPIALNEYQAITGEMSNLGVRNMGSLNITINNAGNVVSDDDLATQIRNGLLNSNLSGSPSSIGRLLGAFQ
jgi:hypothetical protein